MHLGGVARTLALLLLLAVLCLREARCVRLVYELLKGWHGEQVGELVVTDLAATRQHLEELGLCHARQQMLHEDEDLLSLCLGHVQVHL